MIVRNEVSERVGPLQPSRAKAAAALLVLDGSAAGALDIRLKRRATHVVSAREAFTISTARQLPPGLGSIFGTATITEASDTATGSGVAINLAGDIRRRQATRVIEAREVFTAPVFRQSFVGSGGAAAIVEAADVAAGIGTAVRFSADILSGQDTIGWPDPVEAWTPVMRASQVILIRYAIGNAGILESADVVSGTGTLTWIGSANVTETPDTVAGVGTLGLSGSAAANESADIMAAIGTAGGIGIAVIAEAADIASGTGALTGVGVAAILEALDVVSGTGTIATSTGTAAITESSDIVVGIGAGLAAIVEAADVVAGIGIAQPTGERFGLSTISVAPTATMIEGSACFVTVNFVNADGDPFLPSSAQYRIDDVASDAQILGWTPLPITGTSILITVTGAQNALLGRPLETHQLLVQLVDGLGNVDNIRVTWEICEAAGLPQL